MTEPQKAGRWEKQPRPEEALTQGTTIIGVRGPREGLADRKRMSVMPQSRSWKTTALWQSRHIWELKNKSLEKKLVYLLKTKSNFLKLISK